MSLIQKIKKTVKSPYERAYKYFSILSVINDLNLTKKELEVVSYTAIKGNIALNDNKNEFYKTFGGTAFTLNNNISFLKKKGLLVKEKNVIKVVKIINLDFNLDLYLLINIKNNI